MNDLEEKIAFNQYLQLERVCKTYRYDLKNEVRNSLKKSDRALFEKYLEPPFYSSSNAYGWCVLSQAIKEETPAIQQHHHYFFLKKAFKKIDAIENLLSTLQYGHPTDEMHLIQKRTLDEKGNLAEMTYHYKIRLFQEILPKHANTLKQRRESNLMLVFKVFLTMLLLATAIGSFFIKAIWEVKGDILLNNIQHILSDQKNIPESIHP